MAATIFLRVYFYVFRFFIYAHIYWLVYKNKTKRGKMKEPKNDVAMKKALYLLILLSVLITT